MTPYEIITEEAAHFGVPVAVVLGFSRKAVVVAARHSAMRRIGLETDLSLPAIARLFGRLDHTTVLHAVRKPVKWQYGDGTKEWSHRPSGRPIRKRFSPVKRRRNVPISNWITADQIKFTRRERGTRRRSGNEQSF